MKALTLIQPWATAIMTLGKDVENRPWAPSEKVLPIGGRFAIHAGVKLDQHSLESLLEYALWPHDKPTTGLPKGALLGTVELAAVVEAPATGTSRVCIWGDEEIGALARESPWHAPLARYHWCIREPRLLTTPIPCKGALGLWRVPVEHVAALEAL